MQSQMTDKQFKTIELYFYIIAVLVLMFGSMSVGLLIGIAGKIK